MTVASPWCANCPMPGAREARGFILMCGEPDIQRTT
jgi:hypothetical protein